MALLPAALERWMVAGSLVVPGVALLAFAAAGDELGRLLGAVLLAASAVYAGIVWATGRSDLRAQLAEPPAAPPEARVEPLGVTAARAAIRLIALGAAFYAAGLFGAAFLVLPVAIGSGAAAALTAATLSRWEREHRARLVRGPARRPWEPAPPVQVF